MQRKKSAAQTVVWVESRQTASKLPFNSTDSQSVDASDGSDKGRGDRGDNATKN